MIIGQDFLDIQHILKADGSLLPDGVGSNVGAPGTHCRTETRPSVDQCIEGYILGISSQKVTLGV